MSNGSGMLRVCFRRQIEKSVHVQKTGKQTGEKKKKLFVIKLLYDPHLFEFTIPIVDIWEYGSLGFKFY